MCYYPLLIGAQPFGRAIPKVYINMDTIKDFQKWLRAEIKVLRDDIDDEQILEFGQYVEVGDSLRAAKKQALEVGRPDVAKLCHRAKSVTITPENARGILRECLAALKPKSETLSPPEIAKLPAENPSKVLTWIRSGELRAVNTVKRQGARPKYRITQLDLEAFQNRRVVQKQVKVRRAAPYRGETFF